MRNNATVERPFSRIQKLDTALILLCFALLVYSRNRANFDFSWDPTRTSIGIYQGSQLALHSSIYSSSSTSDSRHGTDTINEALSGGRDRRFPILNIQILNSPRPPYRRTAQGLHSPLQSDSRSSHCHAPQPPNLSALAISRVPRNRHLRIHKSSSAQECTAKLAYRSSSGLQ